MTEAHVAVANVRFPPVADIALGVRLKRGLTPYLTKGRRFM
jgi:hypothetical protein